MIRSCILLASLASACLTPASKTCDFGRTCGDNRVCDETHQLCVLPEQLAACNGIADGQSCNVAGAPGTCDAGVCLATPVCGDGLEQAGEECDCGTDPDALPSGCAYVNGRAEGTCRSDCRLNFCGNGVVDQGEVCDDGNLVAGDGCSLQCQSNETCGNGWVDPTTGEQCDDGNFKSHDGCSSVCGAEAPGWQQWKAPWHAAFNQGTVYDTQRTRLVLYDGTGITWERADGKLAWTHRALGPNILVPSMAYDSARHRTVLFGGTDGVGFLNETWEFDGTSWTKITTATAPSPRYLTAMTYDPVRARVIAFGGYANGTTYNDTWEYNGTNWTHRTPTTNPPATSGAGMTFDTQRSRVVMFGGSNNGTYEWDGTNWAVVSTAASPATHFTTALAYDPGRKKTVMFGGILPGGSTSNDTWEYDGTNWTQLSLTLSPPPRTAASLTFDPAAGRAVLVGGYDIPFSAREDVWEFDGAWRRADPKQHPGPRIVKATYDVAHGQMMLFGGIDPAVGCTRETWTFDGFEWFDKTPVDVTAQPPCRLLHVTTYDPARQRVIVFGGQGSSSLLDDTWEWDGSAWTDKTASTRPPAREWAAMAYDADDHVTVLFGGQGMSSVLGDTWEYDGTQWTDKTPMLSPPSQLYHAMTYDPTTGKIVLFGHDAGTTTSQTWTYDKGVWTLLNSGGPAVRYDPLLAFDVNRQRVVLALGNPATDSWELVGSTWQKLSVTGSLPSAYWQFAYAEDPASGRIIQFGGEDLTSAFDETWIYRWRSSTPDENCTNLVDDDGDGRIDCADPDCSCP